MNIILNKIRCKNCLDEIESVSLHDFKLCKCGKVGIDGGKWYLRRIGHELDFDELSVFEEEI
jgi:hypothetical protein